MFTIVAWLEVGGVGGGGLRRAWHGWEAKFKNNSQCTPRHDRSLQSRLRQIQRDFSVEIERLDGRHGCRVLKPRGSPPPGPRKRRSKVTLPFSSPLPQAGAIELRCNESRARREGVRVAIPYAVEKQSLEGGGGYHYWWPLPNTSPQLTPLLPDLHTRTSLTR